jgi:hypothetical protein
MKKLINEAKRLQELAGILKENMDNSEINVQDIIDEMKSFYNITVSDEVVNDWLQVYHYDRMEDDEDYDGEFVFDTGEREDFLLYLKDQNLLN